jgi:uncharacterized Fe-S cluster-containing radical SAM superfamily protein
MNLRTEARDKPCVRCGRNDGTVVLAHYFGPRRHAYGGGMGHKGHDAVGAHLCAECHSHMDTASRDKASKWLHSEEMLHYCALTWIQRCEATA